MRIILGFALLATGLGALLLGLSAPPSWTTPPIVVATDAPANSRIAAISEIGAQTAANAAQVATAAPDAVRKAAASVPAFQTSVSTEPASSDDLAATQAYAPAAFPTDPATRAALARDIQLELARLGCYAGPANGQWSPAAQRAAGLFVTEANAVIPVTEPDFALLSLARAATAEQACGPAIALAERPVPAMGLGGPQAEDRADAPRRAPAYRNDRNVQSLFTNPLGR